MTAVTPNVTLPNFPRRGLRQPQLVVGRLDLETTRSSPQIRYVGQGSRPPAVKYAILGQGYGQFLGLKYAIFGRYIGGSFPGPNLARESKRTVSRGYLRRSATAACLTGLEAALGQLDDPS